MSNLNNVSDDKFIFACLEHEKTSDALSRAVYSNRYTGQGDKLEENIKALVLHYSSKIEHLKHKTDITIEDLPELVPPVVGFSNDLMDIFEVANETLHPYVASESTTDPHWQLIESEIRSNLDSIGKHFLNYLRWYFGQQKAASQPKNANSKSNGAGYSHNRESNDRYNNRRDRNQGNGRFSNSRGKPQNRGQKPRLSPEEYEALRQKQEERAKDEVLNAINKLKESSEREHSLRPANSYHRRMQHQLIADNGLYSYSVGEGRERFVVITKNENMSSAD